MTAVRNGRASLAVAIAAFAVLIVAGVAAAQTAPPKGLRIVVPFPPGGTADVIARTIGQQISQSGGPQVVVENRPGAGTIIATELVARSTPDATTLLLMANSFVINPSVRASLPYDPLAFEPVCLLVNSPQVLVVNAGAPYRSFADFVAAAKARPGELNYATVGPATTQHIAGEQLKRAAGVNLTYVPFAGGAPAVTALLGGHVMAVLTNYNEVQSQLNAGKLRALAVTTRTRLDVLKDTPTIAESGHPDFEAGAWFGLSAPPKTPKAALDPVIAMVRDALRTPEVTGKFTAQGLYPVGACGADFGAHIKKQHADYARVIKDAGIKAD